MFENKKDPQAMQVGHEGFVLVDLARNVVWALHGDGLVQRPAEEVDRGDDGLAQENTPDDVAHDDLVPNVRILHLGFVGQAVAAVLDAVESLGLGAADGEQGDEREKKALHGWLLVGGVVQDHEGS